MSIEDALGKWVKTSAGKAKLEEGRKAALKNRRRGPGRPNGPEFYAEKFIDILRAEIALDGFEYGDYLYWTDAGYNDAAGGYEIHVNFRHEKLELPSLWPEGYPDGVDNIAALMNRGYSAKNYVYGEWPEGSGRRIRSRKSRQGTHFMQTAVEHFNAQYGADATARLSGDYEGGTVNFSF